MTEPKQDRETTIDFLGSPATQRGLQAIIKAAEERARRDRIEAAKALELLRDVQFDAVYSGQARNYSGYQG